MRFITQKNIANTFILLSLLGFLALGFPFLMTYLSPSPVLSKTPSETFELTIPKIKAHSPIIEQVDPWNETVYRQALKHGVAHAKGTGLPGEKKMIFLFAHSSGMPWEQLYYNTIFLRLGELKKGDEIVLERKKKRFTYIVYETKEVDPSETHYLLNTSPNQLILQTCTPIGTSLKRLLVFAKPTK